MRALRHSDRFDQLAGIGVDEAQVRRPLGRTVPVGPAAEGEQHERQVAAGVGQDVLLAGTCPSGL